MELYCMVVKEKSRDWLRQQLINHGVYKINGKWIDECTVEEMADELYRVGSVENEPVEAV